MTGLARFGGFVATLSMVATVGLYSPAQAASQVRSLKIYHMHTREKATIVFKRNGRYDAAGLKKLNMMLRDWRRNEPVRMDPRLFDLIWEVYQKSGSNEAINVVSAYRSPETNGMLRSRSQGVAEKSQHILGKAMDFYIPGVKLARLREIGMKFQVGGVGFYPRSGSPFVHMDVGSVRSWPRMSRQELARLFPDGRTLHRPAEGGNMPGYSTAVADYKKRVGSNAIQVAGGGSGNSDRDSKRGKGLLASLFGGADESEDSAGSDVQVASVAPLARKKNNLDGQIVTATVEPQEVLVAAEKTNIDAPVPLVRPAFRGAVEPPVVETALISPRRNAAEDALQAALSAPLPEDQPKFADLGKYRIPVPTMLGSRPRNGDAANEIQTASAAGLMEDEPPLPAIRPENTPPAADVAEIDSQPVAALNDDEIRALAEESSAGTPAINATTDENEADLSDAIDKPVDENQPIELASLEPANNSINRSFAVSVQGSHSVEAAPVYPDEEVTAHKGARPSKKEATAQARAAKKAAESRGLTSNIIARWAFTKGRVEDLSEPGKRPRFVTVALRAQPDEIYAGGFSQLAAKVDPGRFSGSSVNFLEVKKLKVN